MKHRRLLRFHGLKRPRVRQTWNKYNLYNLSRLRDSRQNSRTFFQQKWKAKALTRGYHGEHIKEGVWERMFSRRLLSVVNMDAAYLAKYDGSEQATGRGSGREGEKIVNEGAHLDNSSQRGSNVNMTPYMNMTYAPMERRLDIAIFRALFASSARQARQFVVHGAVTVNGVKMMYPGYLLNPGDMFQVEVEKVLTATGRQRPSLKGKSAKQSNAAEEQEDSAVEEQPEADAAEVTEDGAAPVEAEAAKESEEAVTDEAALKERERNRLKAIHAQAKAVLVGGKDDLPAKRKQEIRALVQNVKKEMSRISRRDKSVEESKSTVDDLVMLMSRLEVSAAEARKAKKSEKDSKDELESYLLDQVALARLRNDRNMKSYDELRDNPIDKSKPYLTPWRPRPFMSAFAFIPSYLEVNQNICSAVYLRHPVARKGAAEVPTPFSQDMSQLAFNWYLRRG